MINNTKRGLLIVLGALVAILSDAQQLDQIGQGPAVKLNGGINVNQVYRHSDNYNIPDPYSIVVAGNLSTSLYGWSIPLSFTWSNYQWTYTQPFNQLSLHPSYKWVTAHIGYSSMSFSPWSLNGHSFAGAGIELSPGNKFKLSAMYGRLLKESAGDSIHGVLPSYRRMGTGLKAEYNFGKVLVGASIFYAEDEDTYLPAADSLGVLPAENMVLGLQTRVSLIRNVDLMVEGNTSLVADDRRLGKATDWNSDATARYEAFKAGVAWSLNWAQFGGTYERVDPGYRTLGAYYTAEDYINYTFDFATAVWQQKVTLAVNTGIRENNLDNKSDQDATDRINNVNIGFTPNQDLSFSASYSNFYNYTYIRTVFDEPEAHTSYELLDMVSFTQINESVNLTGNYTFGNKEKRPQSFMANFTYQKAGQKQSDNPNHTNNDFLNATGGYMYAFKPWAVSCGLNVNYSVNKSGSDELRMVGPMLFVRKTFSEKQLKTNLNVSYNKSSANGSQSGQSITSRLGVSYLLKKAHNFNLGFAYSNKEYSNKKRTNMTATLGYSYNFGWPKEKKEGESQ